MPRIALLRHKVRRVLTFGVATLVLALVLNWYARQPFHPAQLIWILFGVLIGTVEQFFFTGRMARLPVVVQLILRVCIIGLIGLVLMTMLVWIHWVPPAFDMLGIRTVAALWAHPVIFHLVGNALIICAGVMLFMEMERMVGSRMFARFITGRYVHPRREDRIVMFCDLAGSTSLTEQLGDRRYFDMLNETFDRMTGPILVSGAEVLKYVGDEIIFIWMAGGNEQDARCLSLFFDIQRAIERDREHYQRTYGVIPRFRAGCHRGTVITSQIGSIKRTIDLSGDPMNTCARIASAAKDYGTDLLASEDLLAGIPDAAARFDLGDAIAMELRGKQLPVRARAVSQRG